MIKKYLEILKYNNHFNICITESFLKYFLNNIFQP